MSPFDTLPLWVAIIVAALVVLGSTLAFLGTVGLVNLRTFYQRLHAPTLGTTMGIASIALASALLFSFLGGRVVLHEVVIVILVVVTTPVTLITLGRAALRRDRAKHDPSLPDAQRQMLSRRGPMPPMRPSRDDAPR